MKLLAAGVSAARESIKEILRAEAATPLFIRLAIHDAFAFDEARNTFGANGSIRYGRARQLDKALRKHSPYEALSRFPIGRRRNLHIWATRDSARPSSSWLV